MSKKLPKKQSGGHVTPRRMFYLPADLAGRMDAIAKKNNRPLAWELKAMAEEWIERHNATAKPGDRV